MLRLIILLFFLVPVQKSKGCTESRTEQLSTIYQINIKTILKHSSMNKRKKLTKAKHNNQF